jgi:hypothetical protein
VVVGGKEGNDTGGGRAARVEPPAIGALFALISHQPTILFSKNKPATNNHPALLLSQKSAPAISHQPNEQAEGGGCGWMGSPVERDGEGVN